MKAIIIIIIIAGAVGLYFYLQKGDEAGTGGKGAKVDIDNLTVTPGVGIGPVKFGMSKDEVIKLFGKPDIDHGFALDYYSKGFNLYLHRSSGGINCVTCLGKTSGSEGFKGATDKGIKMGATERQIYAAYGKPARRKVAGAEVKLNYTNPRINFSLMNGKLSSMDVRKKL